MIVIAGRLSLLGFVFKPVAWLAGDIRLRQTFSLRIHLLERQSLCSICPSTIISYLRSLEASLCTSASRSITSPIVFSLYRNKPVTVSISPFPMASFPSHGEALPTRLSPLAPSDGTLYGPPLSPGFRLLSPLASTLASKPLSSHFPLSHMVAPRQHTAASLRLLVKYSPWCSCSLVWYLHLGNLWVLTACEKS